MIRSILSGILVFACWSISFAEVLTVGPGGDFSSLQAALNVAVSNGENDEIRIRSGQFQTSATATHAEDFSLEITGGWNETFSQGVLDPGATVLTGTQAARVLSLDITEGDVLIRYLRIADGLATDGAGADVILRNQASFELADCEVIGNTASSVSVASGGGVRVTVDGFTLGSTNRAEAEIDRCLFVNNRALAADASGGGLAVNSIRGAFTGNRLEFFNNIAEGASEARGGAVVVDFNDSDAEVEFTRLTVRNNRIESDASAAGAGMHLQGSSTTSGPFVRLEGADFARNILDGSAPSAAQLEIEPLSGSFRLRSVAAVDGVGSSGVRIDARGSAQVFGVNITAAGNDLDGILQEDGTSNTLSQANVIAFANGGADLVLGDDGDGSVLSVTNLTGVDPGVIDAVGGNYRLQTGSSAIDSCSPSPLGGIGTLDADFGARVVNGQIDCGAYEWSADLEDTLFSDSFETS